MSRCEIGIGPFRGKWKFLSNFYEHPDDPFYYDFPSHTFNSLGLGWPCISGEHGYQADKCAHEEDAFRIIQQGTPGQAKRLGRKAELREGWFNQRLVSMGNMLDAKFSIPDLAAMLLSTDDCRLVEINEWHDNFWGWCLCPDCSAQKITGMNRLGFLLEVARVKVRDRIFGKEI